jgi:hypothetical protein
MQTGIHRGYVGMRHLEDLKSAGMQVLRCESEVPAMLELRQPCVDGSQSSKAEAWMPDL